jgi:hypothetical protein
MTLKLFNGFQIHHIGLTNGLNVQRLGKILADLNSGHFNPAPVFNDLNALNVLNGLNHGFLAVATHAAVA